MANRITNTPEALLDRSDSKNPASTCKGLTGSGRACRRALAVSSANVYCWQHRDQAEQLIQQNGSEVFPLQEKSSVDTLVQKLGIEAVPYRPRPHPRPQPPQRQDSARRKKPGFWSALCCVVAAQDDDYVEVVRHRRRMAQDRIPPETGRNLLHPQTGHLLSLLPQRLSPQTASSLLAELIRPISPADEDGYIYIFWLTPQSMTAPTESTARSLLPARTDRLPSTRHLSHVITEYAYSGDDERTRGHAGKGKNAIMLKIGRANNVTRRMNEWQRQCGFALNLVRWYPYVPSSPTPSPAHSPRRSSNAGYPDLTRPPSSRVDSHMVHKVPFVKRVERLIHLELAEQRVKKQCGACGKEHREWFQVEANQEGVKRVDACVRRWVDWAEKEAMRQR